MKLYLDENLSPRFRHLLTADYLEILTFQFMGWQGKKNGELLMLLEANGFNGVITLDKLMYSDNQLKQSDLHFFLIQSSLDTIAARNPLFNLLNAFLSENQEIFENSTCSKTLVTDGIVDKNLKKGVHLIWKN